MKVVIQEPEFQFIFTTPDLQPFDGSDEAYEKRSDILMEELQRRVKEDPELAAKLCDSEADELSIGRDYYVDKVTQLMSDAELWGLGT